MNLKFHFRNSKPLPRIKTFLLERIEKLERFEMKPVTCDVTMKLEGGRHLVEMHARGNKTVMRSKGWGEDYMEAADRAVNKLVRQMEKKKAKVKNHKCYERSHMGKLGRLSPSLALYEEENQESFHSDVA